MQADEFSLVSTTCLIQQNYMDYHYSFSLMILGSFHVGERLGTQNYSGVCATTATYKANFSLKEKPKKQNKTGVHELPKMPQLLRRSTIISMVKNGGLVYFACFASPDKKIWKEKESGGCILQHQQIQFFFSLFSTIKENFHILRTLSSTQRTNYSKTTQTLL